MCSTLAISVKSPAPATAHPLCATMLQALSRYPRADFLRDLTMLIPFLLALAGDEAPQAAEGIYHAINDVCAWWP